MVSGGFMEDLLLPRSRLWRLSRPTAHIFPTKRVGVGACKVKVGHGPRYHKFICTNRQQVPEIRALRRLQQIFVLIG